MKSCQFQFFCLLHCNHLLPNHEVILLVWTKKIQAKSGQKKKHNQDGDQKDAAILLKGVLYTCINIIIYI